MRTWFFMNLWAVFFPSYKENTGKISGFSPYKSFVFFPGVIHTEYSGTQQNPHGKDHSTFLSFAPKDNPKIAISVYVEFGGFGATIALPIASLLEEYYLTDTITRPQLVETIKNFPYNPRHYAE